MSDFPRLEIDNDATVTKRTRVGGTEPPDDDIMQRLRELEKSYLQVAVDIATIRSKLEETPSKDWVHLRLWTVAAAIVAAIGLMIRFMPAATP